MVRLVTKAAVLLVLTAAAIFLIERVPLAVDAGGPQEPPKDPLDMEKIEASYEDQLLPIFEESCAECHDSGEAERELNLMEFAGFLRGSINGAILEPGKSDKSRLFEVIQEGSDPHMPPDDQLEKEDVERIQKWINELPAALKEKLGDK